MHPSWGRVRFRCIAHSRDDLLSMADEELMALVADADADAFEVVYDRHIGAAYSLARRICGDGPGAEDSCQDAFLAIWRSAGRYDARIGSVRSWLLTVVHHRAIDRVRRVTRHRTQIGGGDDVTELPPAADDTEQGALERVHRAEMIGLVAALPEEQRQAISLSFYSGYSNSEIGRILGIPLGTVKSRMRRGLERLRQSLEVAT
jgi:RNA polymerase sigma-70 factor (ECF subfamily)